MSKNKNTNTTLFARYKSMINTMWDAGNVLYTAADLNHYVGAYENETWWKRANNNPFYSTRCYQTALKQLGCITMIKRGLWQINGPIPEWFGSFHINALTNRYALQDLEKSSIYWKSLKPEHKVNPWNPSANKLSTQTNTTTSDCYCDCLMLTTTNMDLIPHEPGLLTINHQWAVTPAKTAELSAYDLCEITVYLRGKEVPVDFAQRLVELSGVSWGETLEKAEAYSKTEIKTLAAQTIAAQTTIQENTNLLEDFIQDLKETLALSLEYGLNDLVNSEVIELETSQHYDGSSLTVTSSLNRAAILEQLYKRVVEDLELLSADYKRVI